MKLSVLIPAYNEEQTIADVLRKISSVTLSVEKEVIVIDDGSTDTTALVVKKTNPAVIYIRQEKNLGKGAAVRKGIEIASGDIILIQDADSEYDPAEYPLLIEPLISGNASVVYGSRILNHQNKYSYRRFYWGGRILSWWTNFLYGSSITDESTGYKVFKTSLLKSLKLACQGFEFCPEVTAKILRKKVPIFEVPISYCPRSIEEGKKISWKDGGKALWVLFTLRFKSEKRLFDTMKTILFVSQFSHVGGGEISLLTLMRNLNPSIYKVLFLCYADGPFVIMARSFGIETKVLKRKGFFSQIGLMWKMYRYIRQKKVDLLHVNSLDIRAGAVAKIFNIPCVGHLRVIFPFRWPDRLFVRWSRKTIAVSHAVVEEFCRSAVVLKEKFVVVPNAVDVSGGITPAPIKREFGIKDTAKLVGAVGRIDPVKGYEYFIEAAALIKNENPDVVFLIVGGVSPGDGEGKGYEKVLKKKIADANLSKEIILTGYRTDVLSFVAALDVVVVPTIEIKKEGWVRTEGFGRVAIEAMAAGVPVVASSVGGLKEIIEDGMSGLLVTPAEPVAMKEAVMRLLSDPSLRGRIIQGGKVRFAESFSVQNHVALVSCVYEQIRP